MPTRRAVAAVIVAVVVAVAAALLRLLKLEGRRGQVEGGEGDGRDMWEGRRTHLVVAGGEVL